MTQQIITGNEAMFANVVLTKDELGIINKSQLLVQQLNEYNDAVLAQTVKPIVTDPTKQGVVWNPTASVNAIVFGTYAGSGGTVGLDAATFVGTLAHEIGHYVNNAADNSFAQKNISQLQSDYGFAEWTGLHQEGEAAYNNFIIYRQILAANGPAILLAGGYSNPAGPSLLSILNFLYDQGIANSISDTTLKNLIIETAGGYFASLNTSNTGQTYANYYGTGWGAKAPNSPVPDDDNYIKQAFASDLANVSQAFKNSVQSIEDMILGSGHMMNSLISSLQTLFHSALRPIDPLVLDLNGSGIKTVAIGAGTHFDYNGTGIAQQTAWVTPDEGILALDKNGDGNITGDELIGNAGTAATTAAASGFTSLATLDSNNDGAIDARDSAFSQLRVWIDANGDGKSEPGELKTLSELGITSINLAYTGENVTDANGNQHLAISSFTTADGRTHTMEDVWLNVDTARTINTTQVSVNATIAALPDLAGFGNVASLHAAMALDTTGQLQSLVQSFIATTDPTQRAQIATSLVYTWAGVAQNDPNGRDNNIYGHVIDARKLESLEAFLGQHYAVNYGSGADPNPRKVDAGVLSSAFDQLTSYVSAQLLAQTELKDLYASVQLSVDGNGNVVVDVSSMVAKLSAVNQSDPVAAANLVVDLGTSLKAAGDWGKQVTTALRAQGQLGQSGLSGQLAALGENVMTADSSHLVITGQAGVNNILIGTNQAVLYAGSGDDTLIAGTGDETLHGGTGTDTFTFQSGLGKDTLIEASKVGGFNHDVVELGSGIAAAQTQAIRTVSNDLILAFGGGRQLTIQGYFADASNQPTVRFADGTKWDYASIVSNVVLIDTTSGSNTLRGLSGMDDRIVGAARDNIYAGNLNDTITAGQGDYLYSGAGVDTFIFTAGDGSVVLNDAYTTKTAGVDHDVMRIGAGISAADTKAMRDLANNLVLVFGNGDQLIVQGYFTSSVLNQTSIVFADGTSWDYSAVMGRLVLQDTSAGGNTIHGLSGVNNTMSGAAGDTLYAGNLNDTITAGRNNHVYSGAGVDTFIFNAGDGSVVLNDAYTAKATGVNRDEMQVGAGISAAGTKAMRDLANNLVLVFGNGDQLIVQGYFTSSVLNQTSIVFADGTSWDYAAVMGRLVLQDTSAGSNTIRGLSGMNNTMIGAAGDTIYAGDQNDTITAGKSDRLYSGAGVDTFIYNAGDGSVVLNDAYTTKATGIDLDVMQIGAGISAAGTKAMRDLSNNLVLVFGNGDQLTVQGYFTSSVLNQTSIVFADGTSWDYSAVMGRLVLQDTSAGGNTIHGLSGVNNTMSGAASDTLYAGNLNDTITAGRNNHVYSGAGVDTFVFNAGDGSVLLNDAYVAKATGINHDVMQIGAGISAAGTKAMRDLSNNLVLVFGNGDQLTVQGYFTSSVLNQTSIVFADGTSWDYAAVMSRLVLQDTSGGGNTIHGLSGANNTMIGAASDTLYAGNLNDAITAGKNDYLNSGAGVDTFIFKASDGSVVLNDAYVAKATGVDRDVMQIGSGISAAGTKVTRDQSNNLVLVFGNGDQLTVQGYFTSSILNQTSIVFADGTSWSYASVMSQLVQQDTTSGNQTIYGLTGVNNTIIGATGDTLYAGNLDDTITAGKNNTIYAGAGIDTFIFNAGDGSVVINDAYAPKTAGTNQDVVRIGAGISAAATQATRDASNDLVLLFGNGDQLTVLNYFGGDSAANQSRIVFADGTSWSYSDVAALLVPQQAPSVVTTTDSSSGSVVLRGTAGAVNVITGAAGDSIYAGNLNDTITAGKGDSLYSGAGVDTFVFTAGDGSVFLNDAYTPKTASIDRDVMEIGSGISAARTKVMRDVSNNLLLVFGNGDQLIVQGYFTGNGANETSIVFADGTTWNYSAVMSQLVFQDTTSGNRTLVGVKGADNVIIGATGDSIYAGNLNDTITVGKNDNLYAGAGIDTFIFNAGDGNVWLNESYATKAAGINQDVVRIGAGITASGTQVLRDVSNNLLLVFGNGDQLMVQGYFTSNSLNQTSIVFADGTSWNYSAVLANLVTKDTTTGYRQISGMNGVNNVIVGAQGDSIYAGNLNDTITAGKNDNLYAGAGIDTFIFNAGDGNVWLNESYAAKAAGINKDVVRIGAGISASGTQVLRDQSNNLLLVFGNGDQLMVQGYFTSNSLNQTSIVFADGTSWNYSAVLANLVTKDTTTGYRQISGMNGVNNVIVGAQGDSIYAGNLNDTITAGKNDNLYAGAGIDTFIFNAGDGNVTLNDGYTAKAAGVNQDVMRIGAGITASGTQVLRDVSNNLLLVFGNGDQLMVQGYFTSNSLNQTSIVFADGTSWNYSAVLANLVTKDTTTGYRQISGMNGVNNVIVGAQGDSIYAGNLNDTITAGKNDNLYAGAGIDTFIFNAGDGNVWLNESYATKAAGINQDVVRIGAGISASGTQVLRDPSNNLLLVFGNGDQLMVQGYFTSNSLNQTSIVFADGTSWNYPAVLANLVTKDTTTGYRQISGMNGVNNVIVGAPGDSIYAGNLNDTITAGKNNALHAGAGVDLFEASVGCGAVTITEATKTNVVNQDALLINGVDADQLWFKLSGNNLEIDIMGTSDHITINNWVSSSANQLQTIEVDGGTHGKSSLSGLAVSQLVQAMANFSAGSTGFDPTSASSPVITDPNVLLAVGSNWHQ